MLTFLDIETIPDLSEGALQQCIDAVEPPGTYKKPESIAEWKAANAATIGQEQWQRTALDPMRGGIVVICWETENSGPRSIFREPGESEAIMLNTWSELIALDMNDLPGSHRLPRFVGWNVAEFDLRFLAIRCIVNGVKLPFALPVNERYDGRGVCDLMRVWSGFKGFQKQSAVARALGIKLQDETDGKDLWALIQEKGVQAAVSKCQSDVAALKQIYSRMAPIFGC